jgi:hypothetical protein
LGGSGFLGFPFASPFASPLARSRGSAGLIYPGLVRRGEVCLAWDAGLAVDGADASVCWGHDEEANLSRSEVGGDSNLGLVGRGSVVQDKGKGDKRRQGVSQAGHFPEALYTGRSRGAGTSVRIPKRFCQCAPGITLRLPSLPHPICIAMWHRLFLFPLFDIDVTRAFIR